MHANEAPWSLLQRESEVQMSSWFVAAELHSGWLLLTDWSVSDYFTDIPYCDSLGGKSIWKYLESLCDFCMSKWQQHCTF